MAHLILTRREAESVMIGDDIKVTIERISSDKIRLGVTAPQGMPVHREEVYDRIQKENAAAAKAVQK